MSSAAIAAAQAATKLKDGKFEDAVRGYADAIKAQSNGAESIDYLLGRASALQKLKRYEEALKDAERAVVLAVEKQKKTSRAQAQFRRGVALYGLKRFADAKFCFDLSARDDPEGKEKSRPIWISKTQAALAKDDSQKVTIKERPADIEIEEIGLGIQTAEDSTVPGLAPKPAKVEDSVPVPFAWKPPKHEWYQSNDKVVVTFFAKNVPKDDVNVDIQQRALSLSFKLQETGSEWSHQFDPLFAEVDPQKSTYRVLTSKIEVTLVKSRPTKWAQLEGDASTTKPTSSLAYPTSSKTGSKNWDKLAADATNKSASGEKEEEGDALQNLFQSLYKDADDDTRKAMMKSYQESGGTALSTNWKEVSAGKVPVQPPAGMEARSYEQ